MDKQFILSKVEHTNLRADATEADIQKLVQEAKERKAAGVCIPPNRIPLVVREVIDHPLDIITVIGFPYGYDLTAAKQQQIREVRKLGAHHVDIVAPLNLIADQDFDSVFREIELLTRFSQDLGIQVKWILETGWWNSETIRTLCEICLFSKPDYIKTSTGINAPGADTHQIHILKEWIGDTIKIKASGGIKTWEQAEGLITAGADRIGSSSLCTIND